MHNINGDTMKVRLGYVAISKALDITTSSTITYTNYVNKGYDTKKLLEITKNNINALKLITLKITFTFIG